MSNSGGSSEKSTELTELDCSLIMFSIGCGLIIFDLIVFWIYGFNKSNWNQSGDGFCLVVLSILASVATVLIVGSVLERICRLWEIYRDAATKGSQIQLDVKATNKLFGFLWYLSITIITTIPYWHKLLTFFKR